MKFLAASPVDQSRGDLADDDLLHAAALDQLRALGEGRLDAPTLLEGALARLETLEGGQLPAPAAAVARAAAQTAHRRRAAGGWSALLGLPVLVMTPALGPRHGPGVTGAAEAAAEALLGLQQAGAIVLGPGLSLQQPASAARAVASGGCALAMTWDAEGRALAAALALGLHAHRPSATLVGLRGGDRRQMPTLIARDPAGLELLLDTLLAFDEHDGVPWRSVLPEARSPHLADLRLLAVEPERPRRGLWRRMPASRGASPRLALVDWLRLQGARVRRRSPVAAGLGSGSVERWAGFAGPAHDLVLLPWGLTLEEGPACALAAASGLPVTAVPTLPSPAATRTAPWRAPYAPLAVPAIATPDSPVAEGVYVLGPMGEDRTPLAFAMRVAEQR